MLPYPKYASNYPDVDFVVSGFVYFEATNRLVNGLYVQKSEHAITRLMDKQTLRTAPH